MLASSHPRRERSLLAAGATTALLGVGMSVDLASTLPSVLTLLGLLTMIVGLHRFGRTGPDAPPSTAPGGKRTRKKRRRVRPS